MVALGEHWLSAIVPMQILCLVMPLRMVLLPIHTALNSTGHAGVVALNVALAAVCLPAAIWIGSRWGLPGAAFGWLAAFPIVLFAVLIASRRCVGFGFRSFLTHTWRPAFSASAMYVTVLAWPNAPSRFPGHCAPTDTSGSRYRRFRVVRRRIVPRRVVRGFVQSGDYKNRLCRTATRLKRKQFRRVKS